MNKPKVRVLAVVLLIICFGLALAGCLGNNNPPPQRYPSKSKIDLRLEYDDPVFYFGDVVQDNGSVNTSKQVNWTLTISNYGNVDSGRMFIDIDNRKSGFPMELQIWSTDIGYTEQGNFTSLIDRKDYWFGRYEIASVSAGNSTETEIIIRFNRTSAWTYSPNTTYVGRFEFCYRVHDGYSIYYDDLIIPFVIRT